MAKKDFSGANKTSKTYDKDWTFVHLPATGPNQSHGAWVTKKQARQMHQDHLEAVARRNAANGGNVTTPPPTTTVPITNGPGTDVPTPIVAPNPNATPKTPSTNGATPSWWINQVYTNPDANQAFANAANALLPTLSPEDQRSMANYLATNYKDVFGNYANANFAPIPTQLTNERQTYLNPARAQQALDLLNKTQNAAGGTPGVGYDFLKSALNLLNQYGGSGPMTREQYNQFQTALKNITGSAGNDVKAYSNLAQMFNLPSFSAGPLVSNAASNRLYT